MPNAEKRVWGEWEFEVNAAEEKILDVVKMKKEPISIDEMFQCIDSTYILGDVPIEFCEALWCMISDGRLILTSDRCVYVPKK